MLGAQKILGICCTPYRGMTRAYTKRSGYSREQSPSARTIHGSWLYRSVPGLADAPPPGGYRLTLHSLP